MNRFATATVATRLNALAAAAIVTLALLAGIDALSVAENAAPQWAQASMNAAA